MDNQKDSAKDDPQQGLFETLFKESQEWLKSHRPEPPLDERKVQNKAKSNRPSSTQHPKPSNSDDETLSLDKQFQGTLGAKRDKEVKTNADSKNEENAFVNWIGNIFNPKSNAESKKSDQKSDNPSDKSLTPLPENLIDSIPEVQQPSRTILFVKIPEIFKSERLEQGQKTETEPNVDFERTKGGFNEATRKRSRSKFRSWLKSKLIQNKSNEASEKSESQSEKQSSQEESESSKQKEEALKAINTITNWIHNSVHTRKKEKNDHEKAELKTQKDDSDKGSKKNHPIVSWLEENLGRTDRGKKDAAENKPLKKVKKGKVGKIKKRMSPLVTWFNENLGKVPGTWLTTTSDKSKEDSNKSDAEAQGENEEQKDDESGKASDKIHPELAAWLNGNLDTIREIWCSCSKGEPSSKEQSGDTKKKTKKNRLRTWLNTFDSKDNFKEVRSPVVPPKPLSEKEKTRKTGITRIKIIRSILTIRTPKMIPDELPGRNLVARMTRQLEATVKDNLPAKNNDNSRSMPPWQLQERDGEAANTLPQLLKMFHLQGPDKNEQEETSNAKEKEANVRNESSQSIKPELPEDAPASTRPPPNDI